MRTFPDGRIRGVLGEVGRAQQLADEGKLSEAREVLVEQRAKAQQLGLESAYVEWALCVVCDRLGEIEMAWKHIGAAVNSDPLNLDFQRSFNIVAGRLRAALEDLDRPMTDPMAERLYQLLIAAGEADIPSHLAMARHLAATGRAGEAMRLLDAVTLLAPVSTEAWAQKAAVAQTMGNDALAAECDAQAMAIASTPVPFGIPSKSAAAC